MPFNAPTGFLPVFFLMAHGAWAAPVVTEIDLLSRLDDASPQVVIGAADLELAHSSLVKAQTLDNPVFALVHEDPDGASAQSEWLLSWRLPSFSRRLEITAAEKSIDAASARFSDRILSLRLEMRRDYATWALATARARRLQSSLENLEALAEREEARAAQGESSGLEARRLGLAAAGHRARLALESADQLRAFEAILRWWPGLEPAAEPTLPELPPLADPLDLPAENEPFQIQAARAEAEATELARRASERYLASPELTLGWQRQEAFESEVSGPIVGVAWTLPLFDRRWAERRAASARARAARARIDSASRELEARRVTLARRYTELAAQVDAAHSELASGADMLDAAATAFRFGELPLTDLLDIERSVLGAHLTWLELYAGALAAHREVEAFFLSTSSSDSALTSLVSATSSNSLSEELTP